jgi:uncharacterized membrane protein
MKKLSYSIRGISLVTFIIGVVCFFTGPKVIFTHINGLGVPDAKSGPTAFLVEGLLIVVLGEIVLAFAKWHRRRDATTGIPVLLQAEWTELFIVLLIAVVAVVIMWQQMQGLPA